MYMGFQWSCEELSKVFESSKVFRLGTFQTKLSELSKASICVKHKFKPHRQLTKPENLK